MTPCPLAGQSSRQLQLRATLDKLSAYAAAQLVLIATPTDFDPVHALETRTLEVLLRHSLVGPEAVSARQHPPATEPDLGLLTLTAGPAHAEERVWAVFDAGGEAEGVLTHVGDAGGDVGCLAVGPQVDMHSPLQRWVGHSNSGMVGMAAGFYSGAMADENTRSERSGEVLSATRNPTSPPPAVDHDHGYKLLFGHAEMVRDLLVGFVDEPWVNDLQFDTLQRVSAIYVSDDLRHREGDLVLHVRFQDRWLGSLRINC